MRISIFAGDICDVPAEALCTSTNPRLSLAMGTGAARKKIARVEDHVIVQPSTQRAQRHR